ncbi:hypothetical protein MTP03_17680 [Tsukamurella sp. PLM1]|nr:hypothetical protein MTP03_17680 [Tsukamurella sp. PLM1]
MIRVVRGGADYSRGVSTSTIAILIAVAVILVLLVALATGFYLNKRRKVSLKDETPEPKSLDKSGGYKAGGGFTFSEGAREAEPVPRGPEAPKAPKTPEPPKAEGAPQISLKDLQESREQERAAAEQAQADARLAEAEEIDPTIANVEPEAPTEVELIEDGGVADPGAAPEAPEAPAASAAPEVAPAEPEAAPAEPEVAAAPRHRRRRNWTRSPRRPAAWTGSRDGWRVRSRRSARRCSGCWARATWTRSRGRRSRTPCSSPISARPRRWRWSRSCAIGSPRRASPAPPRRARCCGRC